MGVNPFQDDKIYRCFGINSNTRKKVHEDAQDNIRDGDQYCEIIDPKSGEVEAFSAGTIDPGSNQYMESAVMGTAQNIKKAQSITMNKLGKLRKSGLYSK
jgi:hypothetical protein